MDSGAIVIEASRPNIDYFVSDASFWMPDALVPSAWIQHAPFAFWLIDVHRPRVLVELGTHYGYSYLAFTQAVKRLGAQTRCFAVDTWKGDEHSGFYGDEVFAGLQPYHDRLYSTFSQLMRATFDEAVDRFRDGTVDLLHIDGRHLYNDVKHDFETWKSKLSDRALVVFHDTSTRQNDFGVYRFWSELREEYPTFEFLHGHGLGIAGIGTLLPERIAALFQASEDVALTNQVREIYSRLGSDIAELAVLRCNTECGRLTTELSRVTAERDSAVLQCNTESERLTTKLLGVTAERDSVRSELTRTAEQLSRTGTLLEQTLTSLSWRLTLPVRAISNTLRRLSEKSE